MRQRHRGCFETSPKIDARLIIEMSSNLLRSLLFLDLYFLFFSFLLIFEPMGIFYQMQRGPLILIRPGHCIRQGFLVLMISDVSFVLSRSAHIT